MEFHNNSQWRITHLAIRSISQQSFGQQRHASLSRVQLRTMLGNTTVPDALVLTGRQRWFNVKLRVARALLTVVGSWLGAGSAF
jgi:hypothetical protein